MAASHFTELAVPSGATLKSSIPDFKTLPLKTISRGEKAAQGWGVTRRAATAILSLSRDKLVEAMSGDEKTVGALIDLANSTADYLDWRETETKFLTAAMARILLVGSALYPEPSNGRAKSVRSPKR